MEPFKICLVGHSASGKSSILAALQNKAFNPYIPQTIQSNCWKYTHQNRSFKIYDTSGLDKFQKSTINCLKNSNLIIICFDSSSKRAQIHVEQWLNIVRTYKSVTPIVFIGTKTDKALKQQNEYMQRLRERYPFTQLLLLILKEQKMCLEIQNKIQSYQIQLLKESKQDVERMKKQRAVGFAFAELNIK